MDLKIWLLNLLAYDPLLKHTIGHRLNRACVPVTFWPARCCFPAQQDRRQHIGHNCQPGRGSGASPLSESTADAQEQHLPRIPR